MRRSITHAIAVAAITVGVGLIAPATSIAGSSSLQPEGMRLIAVSASSLTVAVKPDPRVKHYRLFASLRPGQLGAARAASDAYGSALSRKPRITLDGLPFTAQPYYYRVEAIDGSRHRFTAQIGRAFLMPPTPTRLSATSTPTGTYLTWHGTQVPQLTVLQASNSSFTSGRRTYQIHAVTRQFTPYRLVQGQTYYFRVRAHSGPSHGAWSNVARTTVTAHEQPLRMMTYNIHELNRTGKKERVAPWPQRLPGVVRFIHQASPDVIAIEEGASWVGAPRGPRQVDSLVTALGGAYGLAKTEIPPNQPHYHRTGDYVLYKRADYRAVGDGGHWTLPGAGTTHFAAYQILENVHSHARFIAVAVHLKVGNSRAVDRVRRHQTKSLIQQSWAYAAAHNNLPLIYGGDFNSAPRNHAMDAPGIEMRKAGIADAYNVAQTRKNTRYNSANGYARRAPALGIYLDHIFAAPRVAVKSWRLLLHVKHGRFVGVIPSDHNPLVSDLVVSY